MGKENRQTATAYIITMSADIKYPINQTTFNALIQSILLKMHAHDVILFTRFVVTCCWIDRVRLTTDTRRCLQQVYRMSNRYTKPDVVPTKISGFRVFMPSVNIPYSLSIKDVLPHDMRTQPVYYTAECTDDN